MKKVFLSIVLVISLLIFPEELLAGEHTTPSGIAIEDLEQFVDKYAQEYIGKTTAGASVIVIKDNAVVLSKGYGYANIESSIPIESDKTIFEWGSVSKLFVWVSVMQLAEQGKIDLEEDIQAYLPDGFMKKLEFDERITMIDLMNHTAGFEDHVFDLGFSDEKRVKSLEEGLEIAEPKQIYRPGEVVAYSNYSTSLAAYIVEQLTGQEFFEYVSQNISSKLGIQESTAYLPNEKNPAASQQKATGYELAEPSTFIASTPFYMSMYPSGGLNGTAEDLAEFALALLPKENRKSVLFENGNTLDQMFSTSYSANEQTPGISHGFWEYDGRYKGVTHAGNTMSFSSNFHLVPEEDFAVLVLSNQAGELDLSYGLVKELVGDSDPVIEKDLPDSQDVEGTYITARKMQSGFLNVYYYLIPFKVSSIDADEIQVSIAGITAAYQQTSPFVYKMKDGHNAFIPNNVLFFQMENGKVKRISTSIADYLPMDKTTAFLWWSLALLVLCMAYFFISSIVLTIGTIFRKRKKQSVSTISTWHFVLNLISTALLINIGVLAVRMLNNSARAYSEVIIHVVLNYGLTFIALISAVLIAVKWQKTAITWPRKALYSLSIINTFVLVGLLIIWQFYS